jgi:hypothetical protein
LVAAEVHQDEPRGTAWAGVALLRWKTQGETASSLLVLVTERCSWASQPEKPRGCCIEDRSPVLLKTTLALASRLHTILIYLLPLVFSLKALCWHLFYGFSPLEYWDSLGFCCFHSIHFL